ncbi:hypothetical protein [Parenemella sanctibonifatiensis]|uniref:hypothetical protein n=1 Tax=Parenemella sanctibonifatiensis TaxID=2016505 RepID=UPI001184ADC3|nr:hypothetical protein [Parenemella sanctibonifatiensis]
MASITVLMVVIVVLEVVMVATYPTLAVGIFAHLLGALLYWLALLFGHAQLYSNYINYGVC